MEVVAKGWHFGDIVPRGASRAAGFSARCCEPYRMLSGKFAQAAEALSVALILGGILALCQPFSQWLFSNGFTLLLAGWIGLTVFSHRKPVR